MRTTKGQEVSEFPLRYEYSYGRMPSIDGERGPYPRPRTRLQEYEVKRRRQSRKHRQSWWLIWKFHQGPTALRTLNELKWKRLGL